MTKDKITRINLGVASQNSPLSIPNLTEVQFQSYDTFLRDGIQNTLKEIVPITDHTGENYELDLQNPKIGKPELGWREALEKGRSFEAKISATGRLKNLETGELQVQDVYLGEIPLMTPRGSYIINGTERVIVHQLTRSPGVYFEASFSNRLQRNLYSAAIRPERGAWIEFETNRDYTITARINRGRRINATTLLKAFGIKHKDLVTRFTDVDTNPDHSYIESTLAKDVASNQEDAYLEIYGIMRPGDPRILENAADYFESMFNNPRRFSLSGVGRHKINKRFELTTPNSSEHYLLEAEDLIATIRHLIKLNVNQGEADNIDHLGNRRIRSAGELSQNAFRIGLLRLERNIRDRLSIAGGLTKLTPSVLVNARPIVAALNEFFGSSQLSHYMDQTNPLSELEHLRRVSALGPGGLVRERAGVAVRDVQPSHYGRIDTIMTPEGPNIGLNLQLACFAHINEYGFLEAPFRKVLHKGGKAVVTDEVVYLDAVDEEKYHIAEATVKLNDKNEIISDRSPVRYKGDFVMAYTKDIDMVDAHPSIMTGVSSGLIPFISSDAGAKSQTGSNMSKQAVPLIKNKAARVGTGLEKSVIRDAGRSILAKSDGEIEYVDSQRIEVRTKDRGLDVYYLTKFERTNDNSCYNHSVRVTKGQKVKKGDALVDGPSSESGELALGRDLVVAYMPWRGFNFEDSVAISERLIKDDVLTSIHVKEYFAQVMDTKLGAEEITRDIPNVSEEILSNLDEDGIVVIGAEVKPGDILVGKIAPKGEQELTAEERLLRAIFGEKAREIRDTSLRVPHGDTGTVIGISILDKEKGDMLGPGVLKAIKVKVAQKRKVAVGDKIAGRHASKGIVAKIIPVEDLPYLEDGTPVDLVLDPGSVLARMIIGQLLEAHLTWAGMKLNEYYTIPAFDKIPRELVEQKLKDAGLPADGKVTLYDGLTGEPFDNKILVGYIHMMKLHHLIEDKVHARSTGPYSLVTQQPLGGKAQMGGQRIGEMEVWALEAYGAAHILQEMITIKSDDVVGRAKAFEAIIKGLPIPEARLPEAFKLLIKELNSLGLSIETLTYDENNTLQKEDAARIIEQLSYEEGKPQNTDPKAIAAELVDDDSEGSGDDEIALDVDYVAEEIPND